MQDASRRRRAARLAVIAGVVACLAASAEARERVFRLFDQRDGLPAGEVVRLAQDQRGFIWMGSFAGLVRYDGERMRPWAPDRLNGHVSVLIAGPAGEVVVRVEPGRAGDLDPTTLYRIVPGGIEPVAGPDGTPWSGVMDAAFGDHGQLCAAHDDVVVCRMPNGTWVRHHFSAGERVLVVRAGPAGAVLAGTTAGVWRLDPSGGTERLAPLEGIISLAHSEGDVIALTFASDRIGRVVRIAGASMRVEATVPARPIDLAVRGDVVWATFDRFVAAVRPHETPEVLGPEHGLPSGGPILVDREDGLWLGTFQGVMYLPEPETVVWTQQDGLPSSHTRFVAVAGDTIWVGTWQGLGRMDRSPGRWLVHPAGSPGGDRLCLDGRNRLWLANRGLGFDRHDGSRRVRFTNRRLENWLGCSRRPDGTLWLSASDGLYRTPDDDGPPRPVAPNPPEPPDTIYFRQVLEDGGGRLWVAANDQICHAPAAVVESSRAAAWHCQRIAGARGISAIVELPDGDLWVSTDRVGVWRYEEETEAWAQMPGSATLPSYSLRGLVPSADGGVWVLGHGIVARLEDDHSGPEGWTVVERLTGLHGLPSAAAEHLVERPDGSLWITTIVGLVHVPARARRIHLDPPVVELVGVLAGGERVAREAATPRFGSGEVIELQFAALSYRDRGLLRHQYRVHSEDEWTTADGSPSLFRFPDLAPGSYAVLVRASLDGRTWTPEPAGLTFEILPPWYRRAWALWMLASLFGGALYVAYRMRLAFLLGLERQRLRIAMDLHDEIGSGLGSIHILAGLAADRTPRDSRTGGLVRDISDAAAELGASLGEIVWSLRSASGSLDALAAHLVERAARLFPGDVPALRLDIPEVLPAVPLPLSVRWNVALIALEALHNAARHAGATEVVLGLAPDGPRWRLRVADDGRGPAAVEPDGAGEAGGVGTASMRRRADEIGANLDVSVNPAGGMTVTLAFDPREGGAGR